jgi:osmotically-inducible protein OsmY
MRYVDAQSSAGRSPAGRSPAGVPDEPQSWEGEPPTEIETPTLGELFEELDRELSRADVLRVHDREWLADGVFRVEVEARVEAFRSRGGRVEFRDSPSRSVTGRKTASKANLAVAICLAAAAIFGASESAEAQSASDNMLKSRVEVALASASDVPADSITVEVRDGVVTLIGSVVCDDCGGRRTPPGTGTVQQSLGAVVRAVPGVSRVEFQLQYQPPEPPGGADR